MGRLTNSSPALWDHAIAGFFGTWGRDAENLSNRFRPNERPARSREDAFVLSAFRTTPERGTASAGEFWDLMASTGGKLAEAEGSFRQYIRKGDPDAAVAYLAKADAPTREYVLSQVFSEDGSGKFHPLERARLANTVLSDMRRDLSEGGEILGVDGRPIALSPVQRRDADKALSKLTMAELSNGLKGAGIEGWAQRAYIPRKAALDSLGATSPELRDLLSLKMAAEKVPSPAASAKAWPILKRRLNNISADEMEQLLANERAQSPSARLDEALRRRGASRSPSP